MPSKAKVGLAVALLLAASAPAAGCNTTITGRPVAKPALPTEPSFPRPQPTRTSPPTGSVQPSVAQPTTPGPAPTTAPPAAGTLPPDAHGYVFIETKSGKTRCQISRATVGCESEFTNSPIQDGEHANGVNVTADGAMRWIVGNLGDIPAVRLDYQTYRAQGWTIVASSDGTRFTNDGTGHGMVVSVEGVEVF
jgi:hypothetical protein